MLPTFTNHHCCKLACVTSHHHDSAVVVLAAAVRILRFVDSSSCLGHVRFYVSFCLQGNTPKTTICNYNWLVVGNIFPYIENNNPN